MRSRRSRFSSCASGGWPVVLSRVIRNLPSSPRSAAALAAASICSSVRPASSSRVSTRTAESFTSASTFWLNWVPSFASSPLISFRRAFWVSSSSAPARTKSVW